LLSIILSRILTQDAMTQLTIQETFDLAVQHHQAGRLQEAERFYRQVIALQPDYAEAHSNLGNALRDKGEYDDAVAAYREAIALRPDLPEPHNNLGIALKLKGRLDDAIAAYRQAIALRPTYAKAFSNLGIALRENGQLEEAIGAYRQAVALSPAFPQVHNNLGVALQQRGELNEAIAEYRQTIALRPAYAEAFSNLGHALQNAGQPDDAIAVLRQAIALNPGFSEAHNNLGNSLKEKGLLDEAIVAYRQAITLKPAYAEAHSNLGHALKDAGQLEGAIAAYWQAMNLEPNDVEAHSDLIYAMLFRPACDDLAIGVELLDWNHRHAQPRRKFIAPHANDPSPDRRLKIGYVSRDFRYHVVGRNLLPLFRDHDRRQFDITCYAQVLRPDAMTRQFQEYADGWRNVVGLSEGQVAELVREDRIDILVDLSLHMCGKLLMVFARKPAPIQVTLGGYPGGTGMDTIDYRLTDPYLDPPGETDGLFKEQSLRLPNSFWCYDPAAMEAPTDPVHPLPGLQNGFITFGCLNNFCKINDAVLELWAKVMLQISQSRLILLGPMGSSRRRLEEKFGREQIYAERLEWIDRLPREKYLQTYHRIDLCLETFPYNGHTTSLDAFWMGVPVVTLSGKTVAGRAGRSQLSNLGLPDLIANTAEQYVQLVVSLCNDLPRLANMRQTLRQRMLDSPLCDAARFTRDIETYYRQMWRTWCEKVST
jgi:protein O-GlcNAc transferase